MPLSHRCAFMAAALLILPVQASQAQRREDSVVITSQRPQAERYMLPVTTEGVTAQTLSETVNALNAEDALKYLPSIFVRKRHAGDTQSSLATRTSGVGASARSIITVDGIPISALIENNNTIGGPRWGVVSPEEIERIDVMYGPFSAMHPGNSIGTAVEIVTRLPESFEAHGSVTVSLQDFQQYGTRGSYPATRGTFGLGDREGAFAWRLGASRLKSENQPLSYTTLTRPAASSASGIPVTGAFADVNRTNAPIAVLGAGGLERQTQDVFSARLAYAFAPRWESSYRGAIFLHDNETQAESYVRDGAGNPVYTGNVNIGGYAYAIPASAFSNGVYQRDDEHWMHALSLRSETNGIFDVDLTASLYDYAEDEQRTPSIALPAARAGGAGSIARMNGTGWHTLDAKLIWRPFGAEAAHRFSFGAHQDRYTLVNDRFNTTDWIVGAPGALASAARGQTETAALWAQFNWTITQGLALTLGGRQEWWRASKGVNYSLAPALSVDQPELSVSRFSPKASLAFQPGSSWSLRLSYGIANRFPTVSELYQSVTTGATLTVPNPNLKPERARAAEMSITRHMMDGQVRLLLFSEDVDDALVSQSAPLVLGSTTLFNYVQNIGSTRVRGVEMSARKDNLFFEGLELSGSLTYADPTVRENSVFPAAVGKQIPQVPRFRANAVATYRLDMNWAFTLAARYSDRVYATIDNTDIVTHTFRGFDGFFVADARVRYQVDENWSLAGGVDNIFSNDFILFHPFPQRTFFVDVNFRY